MANPPATLAPNVSGSLASDAATLQEMSGDFGRIVARVPSVVARPATIDDVTAIVRGARESGLTITGRGSSLSTHNGGRRTTVNAGRGSWRSRSGSIRTAC
jgi:FAD/FMN-containing dehydrogenase